MNEMYHKYGDVAAFYVVYIREAHAADSAWPMAVPGEAAIYEPKTLAQRKAVARKCAVRLKLDMPCLVDDMDNTAEHAYDAWPDRLFIVDTDGTVAVAADPGPWGFGQGVEDAAEWLAARFPDRGETAAAAGSGGDSSSR